MMPTSIHKKNRSDNYDAIVVGGGIGGLVAGGLLSAGGVRVLLLEKASKVGGYVTGFSRDGYYFDATGAFVAACGKGGEFRQILAAIGIEDRIRFHSIKTVWNLFPDFELKLDYRNPQTYLEKVKQAFPQSAEAINAYGGLTRRLGAEFVAFEKASTARKLLLPFSFPTLFRYARKSHLAILKRFFGDDRRIHLALSTLPTTLPPEKLSFAFVAVLWAKVLGSGVYYPEGGMLALADALVEGFTRNGGTLLTDTSVTQILTEGRRVLGVELGDGRRIKSRWVVANGNPFSASEILSPGKRLYGPMHRMEQYTPSLSAILFYIGIPAVALPQDWPYFVSIHTTENQTAMHKAVAAGDMDRGMHIVVTAPSLIDGRMAPQGCHSLKVLVHAPGVSCFQQRFSAEKDFLELQTRVFDNIRDRTGLDIGGKAFFVKRATPISLQQRTGNEDGCMYGLDAACGQVGPQRPPNRTAIDNLLWVGHYTRPSHGIVGSAMGASFAANVILQERHQK